MKPTYEEYIKAREIVESYEREETIIREDSPVLIGYLNRRIGYNGYKTCVEGHPVFEDNRGYFIEMIPLEGSKALACRYYYYRHSLESSIEKI